jgi:hypothetical protein
MFLAFAGVYSTSEIVKLARDGYLFKVAYEIVATPLTYWIVGRLKHLEGVDVYDIETNFSPFSTDHSGLAIVPLGEDFSKEADGIASRE